MSSMRLVVACLGSVVMTAVPVFGEESCKPVAGHFEAFVVPPGEGHCPGDPMAFCTAGRVWGGIQGTHQFVIFGSLCHP